MFLCLYLLVLTFLLSICLLFHLPHHSFLFTGSLHSTYIIFSVPSCILIIPSLSIYLLPAPSRVSPFTFPCFPLSSSFPHLLCPHPVLNLPSSFIPRLVHNFKSFSSTAFLRICPHVLYKSIHSPSLSIYCNPLIFLPGFNRGAVISTISAIIITASTRMKGSTIQHLMIKTREFSIEEKGSFHGHHRYHLNTQRGFYYKTPDNKNKRVHYREKEDSFAD